MGSIHLLHLQQTVLEPQAESWRDRQVVPVPARIVNSLWL
jgi:hypothetical protein